VSGQLVVRPPLFCWEGHRDSRGSPLESVHSRVGFGEVLTGSCGVCKFGGGPRLELKSLLHSLIAGGAMIATLDVMLINGN